MTPKELMELEKNHSSGGVARRPFIINRAEGIYLYDDSGKRYIDCGSAQGWANIGHSHPAVTAAIQAQAAKLVAWTEASYTEERALWMRDLAAITPGALNRIHPCNSGAEAIEGALKVARYFTGRPNIIAAQRGFHGRTFGAMSVTANRNYSEPFEPLVPGISHVPYEDIEALAAVIDDQTAAVLLEVVQGEGGVYPGQPAYFNAVRQLCDEHGALLIFDEIQTGFGRTGKMFATEHLDILPDVMTLGKSLGGGMPMGAVVWREDLGPLKSGLHGSTFGGNPLACAASRAALQLMQEEQLSQRAAELGSWLLDALNNLESKKIREVRGLGLMIGIQLRGRVTPVLKTLSERGIWALPAGPTVLRLLPPLIISQTELELVLHEVADVLA